MILLKGFDFQFWCHFMSTTTHHSRVIQLHNLALSLSLSLNLTQSRWYTPLELIVFHNQINQRHEWNVAWNSEMMKSHLISCHTKINNHSYSLRSILSIKKNRELSFPFPFPLHLFIFFVVVVRFHSGYSEYMITRVRPFAHEKNLINYSMSYLLYGRMCGVYVLFILCSIIKSMKNDLIYFLTGSFAFLCHLF